MNDRSRTTTTSPSRRPPLEAAPPNDDEEAWINWIDKHSISKLLSLKCVSARRGHIRIRAERSWWPLNPNGAFHGGMVLAVADQCLGLASMTSVMPDCVPATASLSAEFVRPSFPPLEYDVRVERSGRSLVFLTIDVINRDAKLSAKITGTMATNGNTRFERRDEA